MPSLIFRKGLDLKGAVAGMLAENYHSEIVERLKADGFVYRAGRLTVHLAREFGFCYGVDRAVDYAYQTRQRFPDRAVYLTGEIIHNPHVNAKLRSMGIAFLTDDPAQLDRLGPDDVVILPAFGVTVAMLRQLERRGCTMVDTTCGSVLNVWKNVRRYCEGGYTSIIHGKAWHEETQATASQAVEHGGRYLVVFNRDEAADGVRLHPARRRPRRVSHAVRLRHVRRLRPRSRPAANRPGEPDDDADVRVARDWRHGEGGDDRPVRRHGADRSFSGVRHDLQRHPGPAGRRARAARSAGRST